MNEEPETFGDKVWKVFVYVLMGWVFYMLCWPTVKRWFGDHAKPCWVHVIDKDGNILHTHQTKDVPEIRGQYLTFVQANTNGTVHISDPRLVVVPM